MKILITIITFALCANSAWARQTVCERMLTKYNQPSILHVENMLPKKIWGWFTQADANNDNILSFKEFSDSKLTRWKSAKQERELYDMLNGPNERIDGNTSNVDYYEDHGLQISEVHKNTRRKFSKYDTNKDGHISREDCE